MAIGTVDGVDGRSRHRVSDIGHDTQDPNLATLLQDIGHPDGGDVVSVQGQVGIELPHPVGTEGHESALRYGSTFIPG